MGEDKKEEIVSVLAESKSYSYALNGVQLNFNLRMDLPNEMVAFLALLKQAQLDVEAQLNKPPAGNDF